MFVRRLSVTVTTAADGTATAYTEHIDGAMLSRIRYVKTDFDDGVDFTITEEDTAESLWTESNVNASATRAPRQPTHTQAGVASLYAAGGTAVQDLIAVRGRIKIAIAQGGNTKTGTFHFTLI